MKKPPMNAERLLKLYDRVADAPDAIPHLRRFVLDLAVRGKLVEQDTYDGSANHTQYRKIGNAPCKLPAHWQLTRIGDQLDLINGIAFKPTDWLQTGIRIVRIQNLNNTMASYNHCSPEKAKARSLIDNGSFLISWSGTPGTSFGAFIWDRGPAVLNQHIFRCDIKTKAFDPAFLRLAINGQLDEMIAKAHGGVGLQHITKGRLESMAIPLPPLAEQHRIVAKVDELMSLMDRLEAARESRESVRERLTAASLASLTASEAPPKTVRRHARFALEVLPALTTRPDQIKSLRQTILNLAVRGKLVPQDFNDEPASELLKRIVEHKQDRKINSRSQRPAEPKLLKQNFESVYHAVPTGWAWAPFGNIVICRDGERRPVSKSERELRAKNYDYYGASGIIDKIDSYLFDKPLLLIGEDGANLINRATPIAFIARGKYWVNNHAHVLDGISEDFLRYLELYINACDLTPYITGTAQPKMNQAKMNSIPVSLPPLAEQRRIVAKVDALMALCDSLETALATADATRQRLLEALLHEALATDPDHQHVA